MDIVLALAEPRAAHRAVARSNHYPTRSRPRGDLAGVIQAGLVAYPSPSERVDRRVGFVARYTHEPNEREHAVIRGSVHACANVALPSGHSH